MIIDEDIIAGGVTPFIITKLIDGTSESDRDTDCYTITIWATTVF